MEIKRIETYSLFEFCQQIQEAIIEGWRFDFENNENFPIAYGTMVTAGMLNVNDPLYNQQKEKEIVKEVIISTDISEETQEVLKEVQELNEAVEKLTKKAKK